jgi:membrane-associated protease RseP (regulator of RpoE activity)
MNKLVFLCLSAAVTASPVRADKTVSAEPKPAVVPFEILKTKHMAVQIKVNGKGPYRVIFDTGAPVTLLNNKISKEVGLSPKGGGLPIFGMRGMTTVNTLEVGGLKAEDTPVIVMDHPALGAVSKVLGPVDGIVGFPFFSRYRVDLDYQAMTMSFTPSGFQPPDVMAKMMTMMMDTRTKPKRVFAPASVFGFTVEDKDDTETGVVVSQVVADSPAAAAGLMTGDRLLVLDATWTNSLEDCYRAAAGVTSGEPVKAKVRRADKELELVFKPVTGL